MAALRTRRVPLPGVFLSNLDAAIRTIQILKTKPEATRLQVMSEFNLARMYLDHAEEALGRTL